MLTGLIQSPKFSVWCRNRKQDQKDQNPRKTVHRVGRQYANHALGQVGRTLSEMTDEVVK
ncbi:hypothetical protein BGX26_007183, partial [Mortierella sp. AD094]